MLSMARKIWAGRRVSPWATSLAQSVSTFNVCDSPPQHVTATPHGNHFGGVSATDGAPASADSVVAAEPKLIHATVSFAFRPKVTLEGKSLTSNTVKSGYCSERYADLVVRCGSAAFKVHKMILGSRCEYFERLCNGAWRESTQSIIELHDEEELVAEALLTFLYTWNYADFFVNGGGASAAALKTGDVVLARALFDIKVYVAADKYGVDELQQQVADEFGMALIRASSAAPNHSAGVEGASNSGASTRRSTSNTARNITTSSNKTSSPSRSAPRLTPLALTQIIDEVYNGVSAALPHDRGLRDVACVVMSYEISALMREPAFVALFEDGGAGGGSIAADAARSLAQRVNPAQKQYRCPSCGKLFEAEIPAEACSFWCFHCMHNLRREGWEEHVVLPDLAAVWRESHRSAK